MISLLDLFLINVALFCCIGMFNCFLKSLYKLVYWLWSDLTLVPGFLQLVGLLIAHYLLSG